MKTWLELLNLRAKKPKRLVAGLMSGTSADSIDVAICEIAGAGLSAQVSLVSLYSHQYPPELRSKILAIGSQGVQALSDLHAQIGQEFAEACKQAFKNSKLNLADLDLVGSHGQTVYHHSRKVGAFKSTLQIGDGDRISELLGQPVISDFRARDIAAGGEGAPLTPYADLILYSGKSKKRRAVLNLGGIANITILSAAASRVLGFDTGPANAPLDRLARIISGGSKSCDEGGLLAKSGQVNTGLLNELLKSDGYLKLPPPKSTGFEMYGDEFVTRIIKLHGKADENLLATMTEFVAQTIGQAIKNFVPSDLQPEELIIAGGGTKNPELIRRIQAAVLPATVLTSESQGVPSQAREAMAFAVLANDALAGLATNMPSVTGAASGRVLGKLSFP